MIHSLLDNSCAPPKIRGLIGKKIERLSISDYAGKYKNKYYVWVVCECGDKKMVDISNVLYGTTKSCGCLNAENISKRKKAV